MRIKILTLLVAAGVFLVAPNKANAQQEQNQVVVTAGVGYSIGMSLAKGLINVALRENDLSEVKGTPIINGMVDYGITDKFSIGAAYSFHKWNWNDQYTDTAGVITSGTVDAVRQNIGGRALFHFGSSDDMDLYAGARLGTSLWKVNSSAANSNGDSASDFEAPAGLFSVQALFGVRAYFTDNIGANFEVGIGTAPYFVGGGLVAKF